ncbi:MAG TPA: right-handed parallel beta-helix repeat-containing protein [Bacillota bacterium]|nr:right-handed parallel beta-helix repeat-containing protein [Bacillota bacterium]
MNYIYHVAKNGSNNGTGTIDDPFLTINQGASFAMPGDTVIVHKGEYREWVKPKNAGLSTHRRITFCAAEEEKVIIKGSERIQDWERVEGSVWKAVLPNEFFGDFNPFEEKIFGDWIVYNPGKHLGDVYLNGVSFYESETYEQLKEPDVQTEILDHWTEQMVPVNNQGQTKYVWYAEVDDIQTTIFVNFHDYNPNEELVEINVRKCCFYPEETGIDYITVKGFEMCHAATPWSPPTADQPGLIGTHWSKNWIIEDNIIHDSKCSAVSIGKEASTGNNYRSKRKDKPGYQYQVESVFLAKQAGWSKEKIGSHVIRNNVIYDCGQNGIVGHLGCVFSEIYRNDIYNIGLKREFYGHEIAGIKLHAAIDVQIYHNRIHNCSLGTWLDWQTQGTRVSKNLFHQNVRDLFIEVSHGPYLVDHNILTADYAIDNHAQGGAYINNIIAGKMVHRKILDRSTPYHVPHSTEIAGFAVTYGGDDRFYNNIFIGAGHLKDVGTNHFNGYTTSLKEYIEKVDQTSGDHEVFQTVEQPVYINHNAYFNGAKAFDKENENINIPSFNPGLRIEEERNGVYLSCDLPEDIEESFGDIHTTHTLKEVRIADADFEHPDGSHITLDTDYIGNQKLEKNELGAINDLRKGKNRVKIWAK